MEELNDLWDLLLREHFLEQKEEFLQGFNLLMRTRKLLVAFLKDTFVKSPLVLKNKPPVMSEVNIATISLEWKMSGFLFKFMISLHKRTHRVMKMETLFYLSPAFVIFLFSI